jgi:hypothetical protein
VTTRLLLDSGAYSAWTKGVSIDLEAYVRFCVRHRGVSYYASLDVIPGSQGRPYPLSVEEVEAASRKGWSNYSRLLEVLPKRKLIPVFHQGEDVRWLVKYLDFGTPYVGISPTGNRGTKARRAWLESLRPFLFEKAGRPVVRTHGFGIAAYSLMNLWDWYSVDSATWKAVAWNGGVYVPRKTAWEFDFSREPLVVRVTQQTLPGARFNRHLHTLAPALRRQLEAWLEVCGETLKRVAADPFEPRAVVNLTFMQEAAKELPVRHLYLAGSPMQEPQEKLIGKRLLSYVDVRTGSGRRCLQEHLRRMSVRASVHPPASP